MSPEFPNYPAPKRPPRRAMSRGWLVAAIGLVFVTLIVVAGSIVSFTRYGDEFFEVDIYLDDYEILQVVEPACDRMTDAVEGMTVSGTPGEQAVVIEKQNAEVSKMLATIRELPIDLLAADKPALEWLLDWDSLIQARSAYAVEIQRGKEPDFELPLDPDGDAIVDRMDWAGEPECTVPDALLDPFPVEVDEA